jgi:hypothetical protein
LRWHDANNWPILRDALRRMGRSDLIGAGKHQLIPAWQPLGTGDAHEGRRAPRHAQQQSSAKQAASMDPQRPSAPKAAVSSNNPSRKPQRFRTQHTGLKGVRLPRSK